MTKNLACIPIVVFAVILTGQMAFAQGSGQERSLTGVWLVKVTPKNCVTGEPFPTAAFESLQTYEKDGTMLMSIRGNTNLPTVTRTPFHGLWRRDHGWSNYTFKVIHIRSNSSTGAFTGNQITGGSLVLGDSGNEFVTEGYTQGYDVDGNPSGAAGCSNSVGTRFTLD